MEEGKGCGEKEECEGAVYVWGGEARRKGGLRDGGKEERRECTIVVRILCEQSIWPAIYPIAYLHAELAAGGEQLSFGMEFLSFFSIYPSPSMTQKFES